MNIVSYQSIKNEKDKIECPICLEIKDLKQSITSDCKHSWCKDCNKLIENNMCPICRNKQLGFTVFGHWEEIENKEFKWVTLEQRMLKEKKEAERKLRTKEYRRQQRQELAELMASATFNLSLTHAV